MHINGLSWRISWAYKNATSEISSTHWGPSFWIEHRTSSYLQAKERLQPALLVPSLNVQHNGVKLFLKLHSIFFMRLQFRRWCHIWNLTPCFDSQLKLFCLNCHLDYKSAVSLKHVCLNFDTIYTQYLVKISKKQNYGFE